MYQRRTSNGPTTNVALGGFQQEAPKTRAVGYVRVSTELQAQEGVSLDAQRDRIRAYCKGNGIELVAILTDDTSGETMERPGLQKALAMLDSEAANSFVVVKLDRLTRSLLDLGG